MAKIRIHELAKELKINSKDLVAQLQQMGYAVKNHMSTIEENDVGQIRRALKIKGTIEKKGKGAKDYKKINHMMILKRIIANGHRLVKRRFVRKKSRTRGRFWQK